MYYVFRMKPKVHIILPSKEDYPLADFLGRDIIDELRREHAEIPVDFILHADDCAYERAKNPGFMEEVPAYRRP